MVLIGWMGWIDGAQGGVIEYLTVLIILPFVNTIQHAEPSLLTGLH